MGPRDLYPELEDQLWDVLRRMSKLSMRKAPCGVTLRTTGGRTVVANGAVPRVGGPRPGRRARPVRLRATGRGAGRAARQRRRRRRDPRRELRHLSGVDTRPRCWRGRTRAGDLRLRRRARRQRATVGAHRVPAARRDGLADHRGRGARPVRRQVRRAHAVGHRGSSSAGRCPSSCRPTASGCSPRSTASSSAVPGVGGRARPHRAPGPRDLRRVERHPRQDGAHAGAHRAARALRRTDLQRHPGRARQAGPRPLPVRRRVDGRRARSRASWSRTAAPGSRQPVPPACARSGIAGGLTPADWLEGPDTVVIDDMVGAGGCCVDRG